MEARFLRTKLGTDFAEDPLKDISEKLLRATLFRPSGADHRYQKRLHSVREWLVEFDESGLPRREIGLGSDGQIVIVGPDSLGYGFWPSAHMKYEDISGESVAVAQEQFEALWLRGEACRAEIRRDVSQSNFLSSWLVKLVLAVPSLGILGLGMIVASDNNSFPERLWGAACVFGVVLVIFSAVKLRAEWMALVFLLSFILGFSSCSNNFRWYGG